jgi:hypothetical protein
MTITGLSGPNCLRSANAKPPFVSPENSLKKCENCTLLLEKLMVSSKGWLRPDDITMPVAQFWEKAVCQYTTHPLLGSRVKL